MTGMHIGPINNGLSAGLVITLTTVQTQRKVWQGIDVSASDCLQCSDTVRWATGRASER